MSFFPSRIGIWTWYLTSTRQGRSSTCTQGGDPHQSPCTLATSFPSCSQSKHPNCGYCSSDLFFPYCGFKAVVCGIYLLDLLIIAGRWCMFWCCCYPLTLRWVVKIIVFLVVFYEMFSMLVCMFNRPSNGIERWTCCKVLSSESFPGLFHGFLKENRF